LKGGVVLNLDDSEPNREELRILHTVIRKVRQDLTELSFNTAVSAFMICVNDLGRLNCRKRAILEPLVVLIAPFCPHVAEELWSHLGHRQSIFLSATLPDWDDKYLEVSTFQCPISINGKMKILLEMPVGLSTAEAEALVLTDQRVCQLLEGKSVRKLIIVSDKIVNIVVS
jgi:leucyl-tRNA synthetase